MSFTDHLGELRSRLLRSLLAVALLFFAAYAFHEELFRIVARPVMQALRNHGIYALQALQVTETITVYIQVSLVAAVILAAPFLIYQVWAFVSPGLYSKEKRYVLPIVFLVSAFFMLGVVFCYFVFLPMVVDFLVGFTIGSGDITLLPTVEKTFGFTTLFPLLFGLLFQLPLMMFFLSLLRVMNHAKMLRFGRYFVVLSFFLGAMFTPPDPLSQGLMAVPICLLYFVGVAFAWVADLFRREGSSRVLPTVVGIGVVTVFSALIVTASYLWDRAAGAVDEPPRLAAGVPFTIEANPASPIGREVMRSIGRPGATGTDDDAQAPDGGPVVVSVSNGCLKKLVPYGVDMEGIGGLAAVVAARPGGLFGLDLVFETNPGAGSGLSDWVRAARDGWVPERVPAALLGSTLGRVLAWSEGDIETAIEEGATTVSLTAPAPRAARMASELARGAMRECSPPGEEVD